MLRHKYPINRLIKLVGLKRATYYDRLKRNHQPDKHAALNNQIRKSFVASGQTYGYRRIYRCTTKAGLKACPETILKQMRHMGIQATIYSQHTAKYRSYKKGVGTPKPNLLNQTFDATVPYTVLHTDITQVRLINHNWAYISAVIDEASREVLALKISAHPNKKLIKDTLNQLDDRLPDDATPILHSDQGWQYKVKTYQEKLNKMHIIQSMSRKGNCHDNAPIESWFNLLKRECLNRKSFKNLTVLRRVTTNYLKWFNNDRISLIHDGLTPVEYCQRALAA